MDIWGLVESFKGWKRCLYNNMFDQGIPDITNWDQIYIDVVEWKSLTYKYKSYVRLSMLLK